LGKLLTCTFWGSGRRGDKILTLERTDGTWTRGLFLRGRRKEAIEGKWGQVPF